MEHGADKRRARTFGLITEELAIFLTEHGFKDGKPHTINTRLVARDEELIIRMRDDCKPLNLTEYYKFYRNYRRKTKRGQPRNYHAHKQGSYLYADFWNE